MRSTDVVSVAPKVDCIITSVAIAAQYASGIPNSRATRSDRVAAAAVRTECIAEGRFSVFHFQSFVTQSSPNLSAADKLLLTRMSLAQDGVSGWGGIRQNERGLRRNQRSLTPLVPRNAQPIATQSGSESAGRASGPCTMALGLTGRLARVVASRHSVLESPKSRCSSRQTATTARATRIPSDTSAKRCTAAIHGVSDR